MLLSALVHVHSLRWAVPATIMLGSSPTFITIWSGWRMLSSILPRRFYIYGDDKLYSLYQRLILYFFHTYTTTEVSNRYPLICIFVFLTVSLFLLVCAASWFQRFMVDSRPSCLHPIPVRYLTCSLPTLSLPVHVPYLKNFRYLAF